MSRFDGRVVLVTGGATGIGFAVAAEVLSEGGAVVLTGHDPAQLDDAAAALGGPRLATVAADVRDQAALHRAVQVALDRWGRLDGLVCAAGIQIPGTVETMPEADWQQVLDVNLTGVFRAIKAALPALSANGGAIVLLASVQAHLGKRNGVAYVAAKGALVAMTRAMALDHAAVGIRVNSVSPGVVDTPLLRQAASRAATPDQVEALIAGWAQAQPLGPARGRACLPKDIARTILFLLSDEAQYVTGADHAVDGGLGVKLAM
jgi:NAD(P)-dependent dehydrogenase (short-subunit alcohol dehydrogenase family)